MVGDLRRWLGFFIGVAACRAPVGVEPPAGAGDGLLLLEGEAGALVYAWSRAEVRDRSVYSLPEVEVRLWLEYPSGSLGQFLEPGSPLIASTSADQGPLRGAPRPLPWPDRIARLTEQGWQERPLDPLQPEPEMEAFRLPPLGPFACAALGGCFPAGALGAPGRQTCSPCPTPAPPDSPTGPQPPSFEPCPAGWIAGTIAGASACLPPVPCDPAAAPRSGACALLDPCPGRTVDDLRAAVVVDPSDCGASGRHCSLAEALATLSASASTTTIALSAGDHSLLGPLPQRPVRLVGLCPAATRLHVGQAPPPLATDPWALVDLELKTSFDLGPTTLTLERVLLRDLRWSLAADRIELRDGLILNGSGELAAPQVQVERVRGDRVALRFNGPARLEAVELTASSVITAGELEVSRSQLALVSTATACDSPTLGPAWRLQDVALVGAPGLELNAGRCGLELRRVSLRANGVGPSATIQLRGMGELHLEDVLAEHQGAANVFGNFQGPATVRRFRFRGPAEQVFDLNRGGDVVLLDLDLESTATELSLARSPEALSLRAARVNKVERVRVVGFPSLGIAIKNDFRDLPAGRGETEVLDLEIRGCRQGGVLTQASDLTATRVRIQDSFGAGLGLQFGAAAAVSDLWVRGTKPIEDRCRLVSPGPPCQGTALYAILEAQVDARRFELQATYGVAVDSAAATLRDGTVEADVAFQVGQTPTEFEDLLRGVQVEARQVLERAE